ncbi:MAG: Dihydropteroate synthase [Desulfonauticus sp. 38_4375]|nr:MAG: Dihydropteroate synthase [Desulfonauticus sp. 38_4375]
MEGTKKKSIWKTLRGSLKPTPFLIVGILNVTPDSFYDGGKYFDPTQALARAGEILSQGGNIIDVGGESTRPFSPRVSLEEEIKRVIPVVQAIKENLPQAVISVDTYKAEVARRALEKGAEIINDVSACTFDPSLLEVVVEYKPGYVLMHSLGRPETMQDNPHYENVVEEIYAFFEEKLNLLVKKGLPEENIVLDPGIGFGKLLEHNLAILANIEKFFSLGRPLYVGLSNKSMWEKLLGLKVGERQIATQVATALLAQKGVYIHRVHEVKETKETLTIVEALKNASN